MTAPAFQFYAQDFLTGVMYLTNEEIGIYIKMLCKQWTDGKIPKKRLGFLVGIDWDNFSDELKEKFTDFGEFVINERLEKEREKRSKFINKQTENGKKGGRPKKNDNPETLSESEEKSIGKPKPFKNNNPKESQKKPLEIEDEIEIEDEEEKKGKGVKGEKPKPEIELTMPFDSETFHAQWKLWKTYKHKQHGFKYKTVVTEQAALKELAELADTEEKAIKIIHQSIAQGWKGLFELKNETKNGNNTTNPFQRANDIVDKFYSGN